MTTIDTRPAPRTNFQETSTQTRHEHSWATESRHATSAGYVVYVRCTACGSHRVDLQGHREMPPAPLTRVVGGAS
jgi:cytochrome c2